MYLCIYSEDTYPYEVIRHHDCCPVPRSYGITMEIEEGVNNLETHWYCDMGKAGGGVIEIEIEDCQCEPPEIDTDLDPRDPNEIPF